MFDNRWSWLSPCCSWQDIPHQPSTGPIQVLPFRGKKILTIASIISIELYRLAAANLNSAADVRLKSGNWRWVVPDWIISISNFRLFTVIRKSSIMPDSLGLFRLVSGAISCHCRMIALWWSILRITCTDHRQSAFNLETLILRLPSDQGTTN